MVYLNRIYTKSGDAGETRLGDGSTVPKTHPRITAYGGVDELNTVIGLALSTEKLLVEIAGWLQLVQNDLFDLGADLCVPHSQQAPGPAPLRVTAAQVSRLEGWIDATVARLQPLESFVLPGGTAAAAHLHHARAVCRRVEIDVLRLSDTETVNQQVSIYLNRLSDLLFVLARACNDDGRRDVLWVPGEGRT